MLTFRDVVVTPFTELLHKALGLSDHRGGPDWPEFDQQKEARHCRCGKPVDVQPEPAQSEPRLIHHPAAWAGPTCFHFGHQVSDFSMRLLPTLQEWPEATFLFGSHEASIKSLQWAPRFFLDLLDWLGIRNDQVTFLQEPVVVRTLHVAPQAEQFGGPGPAPAYLDELDALTLKHLGETKRRGTVFVSRAGTERPMAGEAYLEKVLGKVGVRVVRPETLPLRDQLNVYASAETLIFTEGSSLHGTQLLGRALGDVVVLNRRPEYRIGRDSLVPRAASVRYSEVAGVIVHGLNAAGVPAPWIGIALFNEAKLLDEFAELDIDIRAFWQPAEFASARDADVSRWIATETVSPRAGVPGFHDKVEETLAAAGYAPMSFQHVSEDTR